METYIQNCVLKWKCTIVVAVTVVVWLCAEAVLDAVKSPSSDEERKAGNILAAAALATHLQPG